MRIILQNVFQLPSYSLYRVEGDVHPDPSAGALGGAPFLPKHWRQLISNKSSAATILVKTHDAPTDDRKAIYLVRDGRPAVHSYYHYYQEFPFEKVSLTDIIAGACQFGSWSEHFRSWQPWDRPNTLFVRFEELVSQPEKIIPKLAEFLEVPPIGRAIPSFSELKQKQPNFFRRGKNTDFATEWTPDQLALFNELHAPVMNELGYPLQPGTIPVPGMARELAQSAARLYRERLEHLGQLKNAQLAEARLTAEVAKAAERLPNRGGIQTLNSFLSRRVGSDSHIGRSLASLFTSGRVTGSEQKNDKSLLTTNQ